jgi:hypothetical protein
MLFDVSSERIVRRKTPPNVFDFVQFLGQFVRFTVRIAIPNEFDEHVPKRKGRGHF